MFNIQGSEMIFLLLVALVILGPEKLPDAVRKFTKAYTEFRKMATGFQGELKQVLDEPMRELRETADVMRDAAKFDLDPEVTGSLTNLTGGSRGSKAPTARMQPASSEIAAKAAGAARTEGGLNFGKPAARRQARDETSAAEAGAVDSSGSADAAVDEPIEPANTTAPADSPVAEDSTE